MVKLSAKAMGKRKAPAPPSNGSKKAGATKQELGPTGKPKRKADQPKKVKLRDQKSIPVPKSVFAGRERRGEEGSDDELDEDDDEDDEDEMMDLGEEEGLDASFLARMDESGLKRSIKEQKRLHDIVKAKEPIPKAERKKSGVAIPEGSDSEDYDMDSLDDLDMDNDDDDEEVDLSGSDVDLGSGDDEDEDEEELGESDFASSGDEDDSDINDEYDEELDLSEADDGEVHEKRKRKRAEAEADYEQGGRTRWAKKEDEDEGDEVEVGRLPIKLPSGEVQMVAGTTKLPAIKKKKVVEEDDVKQEESEEEEVDEGVQAARMASQKGKFGRMGVAEIVGYPGWKNAQKLEAAKEQIAGIGAEILAGGELIDNGPLLTRMSTFSLPAVKSADETQRTLPVPASIRGLALLSQLAVYKDLIPGYRIRQLTATEEAEKVRDEVRRQREGEKLLVKSYKGFLKILEGEIKQKSPLSSLSLRCMCELLSGVPHFNFSENIMGVLVGRVGRRSWDEDAEMVLQTFIDVFKGDITSMHSQTLVRLIARMIKERKFQVHPNVLSALLHLRLRSELDAMRDGKNKKGSKDSNKPDPKLKGKFKSEIRRKWQTKNQKKREKEMKEVEKEMAEAAAEVDSEERAGVQTETLKNLFVLYFSILKNPQRSPLLPAALEGITHFAHHINVDFFRDLLAVLRRIILDQYEVNDDEEEVQSKLDVVGDSESVRLRLLAIVTAFDLLSGQGEALNIDLSDFITQLFGLLRPLSLDTGIEDPPLLTTSTSAPGKSRHRPAVHTETTASLLFRCLNHVFFSRHFVSPPYRAAAFAKRLLEASCLLPPATAAKTVTFVRQLVGRYQKLEGMLDTEERMADGVYKAEMDDPQLVNPFATSFFEVQPLIRHWDITVRSEGKKLGDGSTV